jgi:N-acetylglucosaminyldiphosphoundecaprenol N-acetyl-beta-D-mannosaminyltransferase
MKIQVLSLSVTTGKYTKVVEDISTLAQQGRGSYVCVANVHMLAEANRDADFKEIVNNADIVTPDGMPLVWAIRLLYGIKQDRIAGMDMLPALLKKAEANQLPVYFYGGTPKMLQLTKASIESQFPDLLLAGLYSPPFRELSSQEENDIIKEINASGARMVFVILGCPKQERWMASMKPRINACMVGIGGALPVMVGLQKRAPLWMQRSGLEWLYRLLQEPKRLFKRYFVTNSIFLWLFIRKWSSQRFTATRVPNHNKEDSSIS